MPALTDDRGVAVDALAARFSTPEVLFMEVEGMELAALEDGPKALAAGPAVFVKVHNVCELEGANGAVEHILAYFPEPNYEVFIHSEVVSSPVWLGSAPAGLLDGRFFLTAVSRRGGTGP